VAISDVQTALLSAGTIASQNFAEVDINSGDTVESQTFWYGPHGFGVHTTEVVFTPDSGDTTGTMVKYTLINANGIATTPIAATILGYDANYVLLQDSNGTDLLVANDGQLKASDAGLFPVSDLGTTGAYTPPPSYPAVCFVAGTRIRTERGEIAVEDLVEGDRVHVLDGDAETTRPVIWIGYRDVNLAAHPDPFDVQPIRIRRDAFAKGSPHRDLLVSPPHAVFTGGKLIPARLLVNDTTIVRETRLAKVRYYHVELDQHSVLFSEGLTSESYLDTGNRPFFQNGGGVIDLNVGFAKSSPSVVWECLACAPLVCDADSVLPVWQRLASRAEQLGYVRHVPETTRDPAPVLRLDGRDIRPISNADDRYCFVVPADAAEIRLHSRFARPCDIQPWIADDRLLGVAVGRVRVRHGQDVHDLALDSPAFGPNWWDLESEEDRMWRWTNGDAVLSLPEVQGPGRILEITIVGQMNYPVTSEHASDAVVRAA
jgi:hypothetical protein